MDTALEDRSADTVGDSPFDLEHALNDVAGHLNALHARLVDLTIEMMADESTWCGPGVHTPELYLAWRVGLAPQRAKQIVAIARRAAELPTCLGAFRRGELAVDQMAAIAWRAPWWADQQVCDLGSDLTVRQLRNTLARYPFPDIPFPDVPKTDIPPSDSSKPDQDGLEADAGDGSPGIANQDRQAAPANAELPPVDRCWYGIGDDGRFRFQVECDPLTGMIVESAMREARDALFQSGQVDVDDVDALREIAHRSLDGIADAGRRDRFRISIHLRTDGVACDAFGWSLPDAIRRYITCEGLLTPTFIHGGIPVSVGRSQRIIPERTRRLVILRDQGCAVPGCQQTNHLEIHHIVHWEEDGPTDTANLIALCPHHHRLHHKGELAISGNADVPGGIHFANRHGRPIAMSGARPSPPGAPPPTPEGVYRHPIGERLDHRWVYFSPPAEHLRPA